MKITSTLNRAGKKVARTVIFFALYFSIGFTTSAQYKLNRPLSLIQISGSSTMHDWTIEAQQMKGTLRGEIEANEIIKIDSVQITIPAISLKSGKDAMDENIYKSLMVEKFPDIKYRMSYYTIENGQMNVTGQLIIAGVSRNIITAVSYETNDYYLIFKGRFDILMSQFNLKPIEFLFGTMKTHDKVTIRFLFSFEPVAKRV